MPGSSVVGDAAAELLLDEEDEDLVGGLLADEVDPAPGGEVEVAPGTPAVNGLLDVLELRVVVPVGLEVVVDVEPGGGVLVVAGGSVVGGGSVVVSGGGVNVVVSEGGSVVVSGGGVNVVVSEGGSVVVSGGGVNVVDVSVSSGGGVKVGSDEVSVVDSVVSSGLLNPVLDSAVVGSVVPVACATTLVKPPATTPAAAGATAAPQTIVITMAGSAIARRPARAARRVLG